MPMLVVHVGRMRVFVIEPAMLVGVRMRFPWGVFETVLMLMVLVMHV